jgi:hypothetical protein
MLIEKFIGLARELRRFPVATEVKMKARSDDSFPSRNTFARFGSKQQFATRILNYCKDRAGYDDIIPLCRPIATVAPDESIKEETEPVEVSGFVYLMRSGRHYKIGRSNAAGRREYELRSKCRKSSSLCTPSAQMIRRASKTIGTDGLQTNAKTENGST